MKTRTLLHLAITLALLALFQVLIWQKETLLARGTVVLLKLAPVDPRSLMQGDYMALRYELAGQIPAPRDSLPHGRIVVTLDAKNVATLKRLADSEVLATGEHLLKFHRARYGPPLLGAESFFFQEGRADHFAKAKYGELRVADDGSSILVGLRDAALQPL